MSNEKEELRLEGGGLSMESLAPVVFGPAQSMEELKEAYRLVYRSYLDRGYIAESKGGMRFGAHNLLPETTTFVATLRGSVIATVTLVADSKMGLPMEEIYREEVEELRKKGRRVGEVTMLADRRQEFTRTLPMVLALMRMLMDCAREKAGLDELCITLNPRHGEFYKTLLHFEALGGERTYPSVRDNPALAMRFALNGMEQVLKEDARYRKIYERAGAIQRVEAGKQYRLTAEAARELMRELEQETGLTKGQKEYLSKLYGEERAV